MYEDPNRQWASFKEQFAREEAERERQAFQSKMDFEARLDKINALKPVQKPEPARLKDINLIFAGDARITVKNTETKNRFTYSIAKAIEDERFATKYWVRVLTGPDNTRNYSYIGYIQADKKTYRHGAKSFIRENAQSVQVIKWLIQALAKGAKLPPQIEIWHEGYCCHCHRLLTVPESIERGLGPDCAAGITRAGNGVRRKR